MILWVFKGRVGYYPFKENLLSNKRLLIEKEQPVKILQIYEILENMVI